MDRIIAGGGRAYGKALRQEYESACTRLQARLAQCSDPVEQQAVKDELENLKRTFETRLRGIEHSLFGVE